MNPFKESTLQKPIPDFTITRPSMLTSELTWDGWIMYDWYPWIEQHAGHLQVDVVVIPHSDLTPGRLASDLDDEERHAFLEELRYYYNEVQMHAPIERPVLTFNLWPYAAQPTEMLLTLKNEVQAMLMTIGIQDWNKKFAERDKRALQNVEKLDLEVYRMRFTDAWAEVDIDTIFDTRIGWAKVLQPDVYAHR
ncbi:hypothetical protein SPFM10_00060 [Salmonella phage SPFM10]|nr:hypothetical protein SPFM10_00060 [Salmonella phage SPFM10]